MKKTVIAGRFVISKSSKRKMTSQVEFTVENKDGSSIMKKVIRPKAGTFTEQVVYKTKLKNGKFSSKTIHEPIK